MTAWQKEISTPLGPILLTADTAGQMLSLRFKDSGTAASQEVPSSGDNAEALKTFEAAEQWLSSYFSGRPMAGNMVEGLNLKSPSGKFRKEVYKAVASIPGGEVRTYAEIAKMIGKPTAARAVGGALAANPHLIFIPCHRVVPASGGVGAYRDGARKKAELIAMERRFSEE
jgi:methylated-DNA-[protein]-cysteine S-methyltransferase